MKALRPLVGRSSVRVVLGLLLVGAGLARAGLGMRAISAEEGPAWFRGHGVSFSYPQNWDRGTLPATNIVEADEMLLWSEAVGLDRLNYAALMALRLPGPLTAADIHSHRSEIGAAIAERLRQKGGELEGDLTSTTMGGLPGFRFRGSALAQTGEGVEARGIMVFRDTTMYFLMCQHTPASAEPIERGCDQIANSFEVS
ncbi:MAG: hypothetical protein ACT4PO_08540 [Actinomycetota bacterium]